MLGGLRAGPVSQDGQLIAVHGDGDRHPGDRHGLLLIHPWLPFSGFRCSPAAWGVAGKWQRVGAALVSADFVQAAADEGPADARDGERDFADGDDVANRERPQVAGVVAAGQVQTRPAVAPPACKP